MKSIDSGGLRILSFGADESGRFDRDSTGRGIDHSPEIVLEGRSPKGVSMAVTLEDITHPLFGSMTHWLIWNIEPKDTIPGSVLPGKRVYSLSASQGIAYGWHRYRGPKPPRGRTHTYRFTVYVLDTRLSISSSSRHKNFLQAIDGHVLQQAIAEGFYE